MTYSMTWESRLHIVQRAYRAMCELRDLSQINNPIIQDWKYYLGGLSNQTRQLWKDATSWDQICDLSRRYVNGSLPFHPSFEEPIWPETKAIEAGLLSLHDYRVLTTYSEPGYFKNKQINPAEVAERRRPHLFFALPTRNTGNSKTVLKKVVEGLKKNDSIWYRIRYHYSSEHFPASSRIFPEYSDQMVTNLQENQQEKFVCEQHMVSNRWRTTSHQYFPKPSKDPISNPGSGGLNDYYHPFKASLDVDPLQICIVAKDFTTPDYQSLDLQALVERLLVDAGISRISGTQPQPQEDDIAGESFASIHDATEEPLYTTDLHNMLEHWAKEALDKLVLNNGHLRESDEDGLDDQDTEASSDEEESSKDSEDDKSTANEVSDDSGGSLMGDDMDKGADASDES